MDSFEEESSSSFLNDAEEMIEKYDDVTDEDVNEFLKKYHYKVQMQTGIKLPAQQFEGPIKTKMGKLAIIQAAYISLAKNLRIIDRCTN